MIVSPDLESRFGSAEEYEESFYRSDYKDLRRAFKDLQSNSGKMNEPYEASRQQFLKLLGERRMVWYPTNKDYDLEVEVSRIYCHDKHEYLAFMRIQPRGFRAERIVPARMDLIFHVLIGRVSVINRGRTRLLQRGNYITISARSIYSIRSLDDDQPAYLIFRILKKTKQ